MAIDIQSIWNNAVAQTQALNPERLRVNYDDVNAAFADRQMQAIQANAQENPNAIKAQSVLNAAERKRKALGLQHEQNQAEDTALRLAGRTEEEVQANASKRSILQNMNEVERVENYQRYEANDPSAIPDTYLEHDMNQLDDMELEARYGKTVADMKRASTQNIIGLSQQATQQNIHSGLDSSWYNPRNVIGSLLTGTGNTLDSTGDAVDAMRGLSSGNMEQAYANMNAEGIGSSMAKTGSDLLGSDYQAENERAKALEQLDNIVVDQLAQQKTTYGTEEDLARKEANEEVDSNALDRLANANQLYQQGLQQVPEFLAGAGVGSLVRKGATVGAKKIATEIIEDTAEMRAKQEAAKFAKGSIARTMASKEAKEKAEDIAKNSVTKSTDDILKAKANTRADAVKDKLTDKATELYKKNADKQATKIAEKAGDVGATVGLGTYYGAREGAGAASEAYEQIKGMNQDYVVNSPEGEKLQEQHPDWTKEQIHEEIAQNAGSIAGMRQGATSFVSGAILSGAEKRVGGLGRGSNLKQSTTNYAKSTTGEMGQEYAEEYGGTYNPRVAINQALGKEHFKESTGDLTAKAHVRGVSGAATAGLTTGVTNAHEVIPAMGKAVKNQVEKKRQSTQEQVYVKDNETVKAASVKSDGSKTNFGTAVEESTKDLQDVVKQSENQDTAFGKAMKEGNTAKIVAEFQKEAQAAQARIDSGKPDNVDNDKQIVEAYNNYRDKLTQAIGDDVNAGIQDMGKRYKEVMDALSSDPDIEAKFKENPKEHAVLEEDGTINQELTLASLAEKIGSKHSDTYKALSEQANKLANAQSLLDTEVVRTLMSEVTSAKDIDTSKADVDIGIGKTGKATEPMSKTLSRISKEIKDQSTQLSKLDKNSDEYKTRIKDFEASVNNLIGSMNTRGSLEASEARQAWSDVSNYFGSLRDTIKQHNMNVSGYLTELHSTIAKMQQEVMNNPNISETQAKVLFDKFIGSRGKKGLLTYVQEAMANGGKLSAKSRIQLAHFLATQQRKNLQLGVIQQLVGKVSDDKFVPFKFKNPELTQSKVTRKQNTAEGDVRFTKASEFNNYVKASAFEADVFSKLAEQLLSGANPSFNPTVKTQSNASETSTVASTEPSNTNTQVQEENAAESQSNTETEPEINESVAVEQNEQTEETPVIREVDTDENIETENTDIPVEESFAQSEPVSTDTTEDTVEDADIDVEESVVDDEASYRDATEEEFDATKEVAEDKLTPTQRHLKNNSDAEVKSILDRLWKRGKKETPLEHDIPLLAHWRSIGIVYGKNVFAKAKFKARNVLSTAKLHAAKVAPKGSAKVKAYADLLGMPEEELKAMTSEEKFNTTNFLTGYIELQDKMSQYFKGVLEVNKQVKKELTDLQVKLRATALINFTQKDSQGNYGFTSDFTQAMANAIIKTFQETGTRVPKPQQVLESLQRDDATAQVIFMNGMLGLKDDEVKNKFLAGNTRTNTLEASVVGLGTNKEKFIEDLGRNALNQLGIVLNPADVNINQGIVNTLGVELYNSMLEMGVLDVQRVQYVTNNGEPVEYIDHVNFIWNNGFKFRTDTKENREKYREMWRNNSRVNQNKASNFTDNANVNMFAQIKAGLGAVAYTRLFPDTKHSYNGVKVGTVTESKPFKVTNDDIQTPLTSGSNSEAKSYVEALNNIKYKVNMPFYELVINGLGNIAEIALGKRNTTNMVAIDKVIEAQESRNSQIDRSFDVLHHYTSKQALDGTLADARYHLKHKIMANGRIQFVTDLNPQSDKFIREMIYGETAHGSTTFKPTKSITEFLSDLNNSDNTHELGYALALAQALGVKIERVYDQEAFAKLKDILEGKDTDIGSTFMDMVQLIKDTQENGSPNVGSELIADAFYKVFGNGAARALHAAMTVADYDTALNNNKELVSNLMIEADGIGNGVHNSLRQFAIGFTPAYIHSLKRTGIVTMDLAYKAQLQDKKDLSMIEGAKHIFRKNKENPNDNIADVYQVVSNQITKQVRDIANNFTNNYLVKSLGLNSVNDVINSGLIREFANSNWAKRKEDANAPAKGIAGLTNIQTSELAKALLADARSIKLLGSMGSMDTDISSYSFTEYNSSDFAKNVSLAVKRNFAKAGVTPANYGGKLDGITNQISSDLTKTLNKLANYAFTLASDPDASNESIRAAYDKFMDFVDIFHEMPRLEKATRTEYQKAINNVVNNFYTKDKNGNGAITVLKESLGSLMEKAINTVYAEQFDAIDFAISADNALYSEFILEFNEAYETAIRRRNESKGYATYKDNGEMTPTDPRYLDPLSKKEIKNILANMHTSPVIATAMSNNAQVINQLFNVGNSLIKVGKRDNTQNKRVVYTGQTSDMAINSAGFNIQLGSTIRDMMRHFDPAGAAALVQSVVPTESTTQGKLAVELAKDGMLVLDVFDGAEMMPHLRELIGNKINQITNDVHLDNSLLEAFFHKLNRSNLGERIKAIPEDVINDFVSKINTKNTSKNKIDFTPSRELVNLVEIFATTEQALVLGAKLKLGSKDVLTDVEQKQLETLEAQLKAVKALRGVGNQVREAVLSGEKRVGIRADVLANLGLYTNVNRLSQEFLTKSYDNYLRRMMMYAAQNRAMKYIEKNFLLAVISQFGGVSNGYAHLKESKQAQAVLERFKAYVGKVENTGGIPFDEVSLRDENGSKILSNFLNTDPELVQVMKDQVNTWANKLAPNYVGRANNVSGGFKTVKEFLDTVLNQDAKSLGIDPTLQKTIGALATPIRNIVKEGTKIYSDKAEFERITEQSVQGAGAYNYRILDNGNVEHLIYVDPNQENIVTTFHEINHGIQNFIFDSYILNPEGLDKEVVQGMDVLKKIAIDMASLYQNNPDVMSLLNEANQLSQFDVNSAIDKSNALLGNMANITYVFGKEAAKNLSPKDLATAQIHALKEFYAYGLSQPEILNRMRYNGIRSRKEGLFGLIDKLVKLFQTMRDRVAQAFGYTDRQEAPDSFLIDALSAINAIEHRLGKLGGQIHGVHLNDMSTKTLSRVAPKNHLLFQVAGLTATTTTKSASEVFKDIVDTNPNISKEHGQYLQSLFDSVNQAIVDKSNGKVPFATNYAQAWDMIRDNDLAQDANNIVRDLAQVGITLNDAEKTAFKLMYAVNKANFDKGNNQLLLEAEQFVQGIMQNIDPSKFLHQGQIVYNGTDKFNAVFNNTNGTDQLALVTALANTNEEFRNYLNQAINNQGQTKGIKKFGKKLKEAFNNVTLNSSASKYIDNIKDYSVIDQLGLVSASLDFNTKANAEARIQQQRELAKADQKQMEAAQFVNDFADGLSSKTVNNLVKGVGGFVLSGQMRDKTDADSTFRQMIQDVINNKEYLAGKPTIYSKIYRWFMGAYEHTQYAYKLRSQFAVMSDAVREKVGNAITATVEKDFKELTDTKRKAIAKAVNPTRLHALDNLSGNLKVNITDILSNPKTHSAEISAFKQELDARVRNLFSNESTRTQDQIINYLNWQVAGLGELMVRGVAKGSKNTTHGILPNVKAIGALVQFKQGVKNLHDLNANQQQELNDVLQGLSTLHALNHVSDADKATLVDMFKTERKGMASLFAELTDMDNNADKVDPDSLLGFDGYSHNKRNPNQEIQILDNPTEAEIQELNFLGWEHSLTLPNGEKVFTTQNSLHNNWTAGSFGNAELSVRGANSVTGRSLRSTGALVDSKAQLGKELQQRLHKIVNTPDYYNTLTEDSHYKPVINRFGSITGYEVDVSNKQRDMFIESTENDIAAIGNYQARLVEEGIVAKNNEDNIKVLNQVYQQSRDKKLFTRIDGQAKPRSNKPSDVQYAQRLNDFYYSLPAQTRALIDSQDGLMVHTHEVDNLIGYYQASTADIFTGTSGLPEPVQKAFIGVMREFYKISGVKSPAVLLRQAGRFTSEFASLTKDFILNRSVIVPAQNILSNVLQLVTAGVPVNKVVPLMVEGYRNAKAYTTNQSKIISIEHQLATRKLSLPEQAKLKAEIKMLEQANSRNPAKVLVQNGILTSVTDLSITNDKEDNQFSMFNQLSKKVGLDKVQSAVPQGIKEVLIQDGTKMHNTMMQLMDYGDFTAKYALYQHMVNTRGLENEHAINVIRDEFVDYAMNRGREFDWMNKVGLTWFLSYKLAIQKIFFRNLRRNVLRTMAVWGSARAAGAAVADVPLIRDVIGETVMDQTYAIKHSLYHLTPQHDSILDSHWLHKVLEAF